MPKNPYFDTVDFLSEQQFVDDLTRESIEVYGQNVYYLPKTINALKQLLGEDIESSYLKAVLLCVWCESKSGFEGNSAELNELGFSIDQRITLVVSKTEFGEVCSDNNLTLSRPKEGDLIYYPTTTGLFEIEDVDKDIPFHPLGGTYCWKVQCKLWKYAGQLLATGIPEIDKIAIDFSPSITVVLNSGSGVYSVGETVYQGDSYSARSNSARVKSYHSPSKTLQIYRSQGVNFSTSLGNIKGNTSSASWSVSSVDYLTNVVGSDNKTLQTDADTHLNYDESNPFGVV